MKIGCSMSFQGVIIDILVGITGNYRNVHRWKS